MTLGWSRAELRAGTLVQLEGEGGVWAIQRATIGPMTVQLELAREVAGAMPLPPAASAGRVLDQPDVPHGPTLVRLHELPSVDGSEERPVVSVLAAGPQPGWRRAALSASFDGGASWIDIGGTAAPAVLGTVTTLLPAAGSALIDAENSVLVELLNDEMELLSRDDDALVAGANLALIGEELVQFGRAEPVGDGVFRLSRLLRGRRGTEWAAAGHAIGEGFALIEPQSVRIVDPPPGLGAGAVVELLASGITDEEAARATLTVTGEAVRPPAPVHLAADPASGGSTYIRWVRRSRQGWTWPSGADTPLGEERELYRLTFNGQRSAETATAAYLYTASERAGTASGR